MTMSPSVPSTAVTRALAALDEMTQCDLTLVSMTPLPETLAAAQRIAGVDEETARRLWATLLMLQAGMADADDHPLLFGDDSPADGSAPAS